MRRRQRISWNFHFSQLLCLAALLLGMADAATSGRDQVNGNPGNQQSSMRVQYRNGNYAEEGVYSTLSDIWLCLACALGWSVWLVSARVNQFAQTEFDMNDSVKVMGHVLQVSLGEDADGTGIPVYHALVDYVLDIHPDQEPIQVRKCFATHKLLEEGFANVEVLVLVDDPTTAILMDDYLHEKEATAKPPSMIWVALMYLVAMLLIGSSLVGGLHALNKLEPEKKAIGWLSFLVGTLLLGPTAIFVYNLCKWCYLRSGDRPGVILHGNLRQCGVLDPIQNVFGSDAHTTEEKSSVELKSVDRNRVSPRYPNAGCDYGNYNVHMEEPTSSVSSISSTQTKNSLALPQLTGPYLKPFGQSIEKDPAEALRELEELEKREASTRSIPS